MNVQHRVTATLVGAGVLAFMLLLPQAGQRGGAAYAANRPQAGGGAAVATDVYKVSYFDTATATTPSASGYTGAEGGQGGDGDGIVRIANPTSNPVLCAMIYVYDDAEEEQECCGCPVTTEGLRTLSTKSDLTSNPWVAGANLSAGVIKVVASLPNSGSGSVCDPALTPSLTPTLKAWSSHTEFGTNSESETAFSTYVEQFLDASLDATDEATLVSNCALIVTQGSGRGHCGCGHGDDYPATPHAHKS